MRYPRPTVLAIAATLMLSMGSASAARAAPVVNLDECPILAEGYRGGCVNELQLQLNLVQDPNIATDGYFGPDTKTAVVAFQANHDLKQDGMVGTSVKAALAGELFVPTPRPGPKLTTPSFPSAFNPDRAAEWAGSHYSKVNASSWRTESESVANHCTEFVSSALHEGGLPHTGSWHPGKKGLEVRLQKAYYVTNSLRNWLLGNDGWIESKPISLDDPAAASNAGARPGDIVYYSWDGKELAHSSHVAIVVEVTGGAVTVVEQGEGDSFNRRLWDMSRSQPERTIHSVEGNATAVLLSWRR